MSILAEPRRKQRISVDPQNIQWRDDDNKVSKKMMEKMGWKDGKGLGRDAHGNVDAVKLKANHSGKGLGADKLASYDSTWIGHHDDFADLLAALNKNKPKEEEIEDDKKARAEKISIELSSKSVKRRIHYQKFTRMKDTANYSAQDKSAVLGVGLKRHKAESPEAKKDNSEEEEVSKGNTTVSNMSVGDYFAQKMAALKAKSMSCATAVKTEIKVEGDYEERVVKEEMVDDDEAAYGRPAFNQNYASFAFSYDSQVQEGGAKVEEKMEFMAVKEEIVEEDEEEERRRRKAEKKLRKQMKKAAEQVKEEPVEIKEEPVEADELTEKQRRKLEKRLRKQQEQSEEVVEGEPSKKKRREDYDETIESDKKKMKKDKKKKSEE